MKIEKRRIKAKMKQNEARGFFSPWIFEPSQRSRHGQKTIMIAGEPEVARKRNGIERTERLLARRATLLLNQRLRRRTSKSPRPIESKMLGSLIEKVEKPKVKSESF